MTKSEIKIGDVVHLRSGGPNMTVVDSLGHSETIDCKCMFWNESENKFEVIMIVPTALVVVEP